MTSRAAVDLQEVVNRRSLTRSQSRGGRIIIAAVVAAQFFDITIFNAGGFVVSAQKILVGLAIPLGVVMLGRIRVPIALVTCAFFFLMALSAGWIFGGIPVPGLGGYLVAGILNVMAAVALVSALICVSGSFGYMARVWIVLGTLTGLVTIGQFAGAVPLFAVSAEYSDMRDAVSGYVRGTGFKFDPNFQATMLVIGLVFARFYSPRRLKTVLSVVLVVAIGCTLSRMGILLAVLVLLTTLNPLKSHSADAVSVVIRRTVAAVLVVISGWTLMSLVPGDIQTYMSERAIEAASAATEALQGTSATGNGNLDSADERGALLRGTVRVIQDHPVSGVGAGQLPRELAELGLPSKAAHNTYLEVVAVGGIWGIFLLTSYVVVALRGVLRVGRSDEAQAVKLVLLCFAVQAFLITFLYNSFFWVPLCLIVGMAHSRMRSEQYPVEGGSE